MKFLFFPDWLGRLPLRAGNSWLGVVPVLSSLMHIYLAYLMALGLIIFAPYAQAQKSIRHDGASNKIVYCHAAQNCEEITIPPSLSDILIDSEFSIETFFGEKQYLLLTPKENYSANVCYAAHLIQNKHVLEEPSNILEGSDLCSYRFADGGELVNRYRDGAMWREEVYRYHEGTYRLVLVDKCVDCPLAFRTYHDESVLDRVIVSNSLSYEDRHPVMAAVNQTKAYLYDSPALSEKTRMYLIEGDQVALLDGQYQESTDTWWYFIAFEHPGRNTISMWIKSSDIKLNSIQ